MPTLFHFDIPTWGNYGDKALFPVVRDAFRTCAPDIAFTSAAALRREVDDALVDRINDHADAVVIGGGGLFLQDTNPNRLSGWQWKISAETLARIEVPLIVYAVGDNRFPGQPEFDELLRSHVRQVHEQSIFFGLRNTGSLETMSKVLEIDRGRLDYQPCPTTLAGLLYAPLAGRRPDPREKVIAIQMLVHPRQQAARFDAEVIHRATIESARRLVERGWRVLSTPFHPDDAEVSRRMLAEVPEVKEIRLCGADVGFFAGFDLFSTVPYVLGGRGHAQMIPFGVGSIPISLDLHAKLGYFARDIGHPEFVIPVGPEGMVNGDAGAGAGAASDAGNRGNVLAERVVAAVENAYDHGADLQDDLAATRELFWEVTRDNHARVAEALQGRAQSGPRVVQSPSSGSNSAGDARSDLHLRTAADIAAEEFHLAAVSEAEEVSAVQRLEFSRVRREHTEEVADLRARMAQAQAESKAERDELRTGLERTFAEAAALARDREDLRERAEASERQLAAVENRNAKDEAKVFLRKTIAAVKWRATCLRRRLGGGK